MKNSIVLISICCLLISCKKDKQDIDPIIIDDDETSIIVKIENIVNIEGKMIVAAYDSESTWDSDIPNRTDGNEYELQTRAVEQSVETFTFENVEAGTYGISLYHDENDNNEIDLLGGLLPMEPYGFSNNFEPVFSAPSFSDVSFKVEDKQQLEITISLIQP